VTLDHPSATRRTGWRDRRRDLAGWLLPPLLTLVVAPVTAGAVGVLLLLAGSFDQSPTLCAAALADNRCEERTLAVLGEHAVLVAVPVRMMR
jgi:hypothetical protein